MTTVKPYYRLSSEERTALGLRYVGRRVTLRLRDTEPTERLSGELVAAARMQHGTTTDVLVLRRSGHYDRAFSGATVHTLALEGGSTSGPKRVTIARKVPA